MAITNAQQYQQLVNKPANGKRPGYRGKDYGDEAKGTGAYSGSSKSKGPASSPFSSGFQGAKRASTSTPTRSRIQEDRQKDFQQNPDRYKTNVRGEGEGSNILNLNIPDFRTAASKGINFFKKSYYNRFPNNPEMEFRFIDQMSEEEYDDLPQSLKDAFEKTKTSPAIKSGKTYKDFDKLSFEDFSVLANDPKFKQYAYDRGSPGLFVSGDMSKVGDKFVKKDPITGETLRDPKTGQILYGYSPVRDGGDGEGAMSDYERRLLELERALAAANNPVTPVETPFTPNFRLMADGGMTEDAPVGGIMDLESGRQMYFLGKLVKKATRGIKKIIKSPIGMAGLGFLAMQNPAISTFIKKKAMPFLFEGGKFSGGLTGGGKLALGGALTLAPFLFGNEEEEEQQPMYAGADLPNPVDYYLSGNFPINRRLVADGGIMRTNYQEGGDAEPVAKKTMPLLDMDGKEKDYRETGGFVDMGRMERADDVPARLSKNEFVFTADAVRNAGEGDIDKGAEVMYNMMKNLESGGEVSEESQGLDGAREMFQTSKRLEEVL